MTEATESGSSAEEPGDMWTVHAPTVALLAVLGAVLILVAVGVSEVIALAGGLTLTAGVVAWLVAAARKQVWAVISALPRFLLKKLFANARVRRLAIWVAAAAVITLAFVFGAPDLNWTSGVAVVALLVLAGIALAGQLLWFRASVKQWRADNGLDRPSAVVDTTDPASTSSS